MLDKNKVVLGLSGGVDSATAALILREQGYELYGFCFDVKGDGKELEDAQKTADELGIELITADVSAEFDAKIINNFCSEYLKARTPNPCIICNPNIKFKQLMEAADKIGAYYIATGHYARIFKDDLSLKCYIRQGANMAKDQSYMLYRLPEEYIQRIIFPLGDLDDKNKVRALAEANNLSNAMKKDSQEICFIDDDSNYIEFLESRGLTTAKGNFVDKDGNVLGEHKGISNYTIGQRKGLGISLGKPAFVCQIKPDTNEVVLGDNEDLFKGTISASDCVFSCGKGEDYLGKALKAKLRYAQKPENCRIISSEDDSITVEFDSPQRAVTPGQSLVLYQDDVLIGGGFING
ncbi:MAG: tRNA 2-thiouridine(34) synthase MnmA [Clostridia bacterium]|nr:tRNA 2-thiouridine(34) synthase MnmA [Clostridia bacterium]